MIKIKTPGTSRGYGLLLSCFCWLLTALLAASAQGEAAPVSLFSSGGQQRSVSVDPSGQTAGYSAVLYNSSNGLPTSEANTIAETSDGFIWIGSYSGLIRYDGNTFERIDSTDGIASVICLYVDSRDRLWIGTNDSGVFVMDQGEYQRFTKADGLGSSSVRAFVEDAAGTVYAATTAGICMISPDMTLTPLQDERLSAAYIRDMRIAFDGQIYGLTQDGDLFKLRDGQVTFFLGNDVCRVKEASAIFPDPQREGILYVGTDTSTVYYGSLEDNFSSLGTVDVSPLTYLERFEQFGSQVWICAGNGIGKIEDHEFTSLQNVPMNNSVGRVMTDYEGNLWFTSTRQGVMKIVPNQFADIYERCGLDTAVVNSTCQYGNQLFIGTDDGLTVVAYNHEVTSVPLTRATTASGVDLEQTDLIEMLDGCRIRSIIRDSQGRLWLSIWRKYGLLRYDQGELTCFGVEEGLLSDRVRTVYERQDGVIMVALTGGVVLIDGDQVVGSYGAEAGLINTEILTVAEAANGDMLLGSDGGGLYILNGDGIRQLGTEEGLASEVVMRIRPDNQRDIYWIVTSNSIAWMDSDYQVTTVHKFPYSNNFDLYENSRGEMWVLSSNGIYVVGAEELLANGDIAPVYYGTDNGLPHIATANSYSELTPEGKLYIASSTGVTEVDIERPFEDVNDLKMSVPFISADDEWIYPDESGAFTVASGVRKVTIYSYVFNYSLMNPQVTYSLDGFDQASATVSRSSLLPVDYTNLRGGDYRFTMQLRDAQGYGSNETSVLIVKEKALYEQIWFMLLVCLVFLLILAALISLYIRRKTRKLEQKQRENAAFISEMTEAFAKIIDMKDKYTNGHSSRVAKYTVMLARELGYSEEDVEKYHRIALLHDIGKIGIPPEVLNKPGRLTDEEYAIMKSHSSLGYDALKDISIMPELAIGAGAHHERPDGKGYPNGLKGDEIPRVAQIIAVADTFDAMYSTRPYRKRMNFEKVVSIIRESAGTQLTADVVDAFLRLVDKGEFRDPDDQGEGTTENIDNTRATAGA